ncbi:hypothetical protein [Clostridium uliginosum]|uniref:Uncharacterized protein n=1 Tax=Clostridium uliginosum TaxID=119641 RepID=A0A1I1KL42_9CLOT|nr:hypothetical protein [Clostridium uliginosum]SFC61704.1 hypothetical protein SAMN05421842_10667 [Clostridium uliginosum]
MPLILIIIGIILITYNYSAIKKNNTSFKNTLYEEKENLNDYKMQIGLLRKDIAESLTELQEEIKNIKINLNMTNDIEEVYENKNNVLNHVDDLIGDTALDNENLLTTQADNNFKQEESEGVISDINFEEKVKEKSSKTYSIQDLIKQGLNDDEISKQLSISKGEILLVRNLFRI